MRKLEWSAAVAQMAQTWAKGCNYEHSPSSHRPGCGENLAASAGTAASWANDAIDPWADERHDYTFGQTIIRLARPDKYGHRLVGSETGWSLDSDDLGRNVSSGLRL
ncbi:cysteine-rich secretory protein 3-like [Paramacrobiotus metropolitanus]|uniref:cysteine-rich secretory protein 3-like n=1 Tax=Paramacrobiotus metropolitanus TaxID=2943436 RepID=UPI002445D351|nr:cysteine-rich secretory protein 3-like [Paramacrobiotus metropolitanus]